MALKDPKSFLKNHYIYEINMLRQTLLHHKENPENAIVKNALYVSFCVHARCLCYFFSSDTKIKSDDVLAKDLASSWDTKKSATSNLEKLHREAINKQVAHLTDTRETAEQIDEAFMQTIHDALVKDHEQFENLVGQIHKGCLEEYIKIPRAISIRSDKNQANVAIYASSVSQ
jgi:hypothetical protein